MPGATHSELFNCTVDEFFKVASDYENYPRFLNEVKECRVLKTEGGRKLAEFKVSVIKSFTYKLWLTEQAPTLISWVFDSGDVFKTSTGSWKLEEKDGKCLAHYAVDATFGMFVPGPIAKTLLSVNLPAMMNAYHKRLKELYGK